MSKELIEKESLESLCQTFVAVFGAAESNFLLAAQVYVKILRRFGEDGQDFLENLCPKVTRGLWRRLEAVGEDSLDIRLLTSMSISASSLRKLPIIKQRLALDGGVRLLVGNNEILNVSTDNLTSSQVHQVFAKDHIRDIAEQRVWLESNKPITTSKVDVAYRVVGGKLRVVRGCEIGKQELLRLLSEMV